MQNSELDDIFIDNMLNQNWTKKEAIIIIGFSNKCVSFLDWAQLFKQVVKIMLMLRELVRLKVSIQKYLIWELGKDSIKLQMGTYQKLIEPSVP